MQAIFGLLLVIGGIVGIFMAVGTPDQDIGITIGVAVALGGLYLALVAKRT